MDQKGLREMPSDTCNDFAGSVGQVHDPSLVVPSSPVPNSGDSTGAQTTRQRVRKGSDSWLKVNLSVNQDVRFPMDNLNVFMFPSSFLITSQRTSWKGVNAFN